MNALDDSSEALVVTIDGPAGAGKSTVARRLAKRLGYRLLDTGALYRAVALLASRRGVGWDDGAALAAIADGLELEFRLDGDRNQCKCPPSRTRRTSWGATRPRCITRTEWMIASISRSQ